MDEEVKVPGANLIRNKAVSMMLQTLALFLIITGVRFAMVWRYGSDLPYWDQWGTEGQALIKKYFDGNLDLAQMFAPSNEHRVFFTRLIALSLALLNSQWDARVEMLVNAVICGAGAAWLFYYGAVSLRRMNRWIWYVVVALVFSLPFGWENLLTGFQSQFYLLALFSGASIVMIVNYPAFSLKWVTGCFISVCALFTMASGVLASVASILMLAVILVRDRTDWKRAIVSRIPSLLACIVIAAAGFLLMVRIEGHAGYQSQDLWQFLSALMACLSWPNMGSIWWGIVSWLPFVGLSIWYILKKPTEDRAACLALGMGLWLILQYAATAFSRATIVYSARYFDMYSYGLVVNVLCALLLLQAGRSTWKYALYIPFAVVWLYVNGTNLYALSFNGAAGGRKLMYDVESANTGAYLLTGNFDFLIPKRDKKEIPFPIPEKYAELLNDPVIRRLLPGGVRPPLPMQPLTGSLKQIRNEMGILDQSLHPGQISWIADPAPQGMSFEAMSRKNPDLPYVVFYLIGSLENVVVNDDQNRPHPVKKLPITGFSGGDGVWTPVYAYCPGILCNISGSSKGNTPIVFSEPREMGRLSLWGLYAGFAGMKLFWAGLAVCAMAIIIETAAWIRSWGKPSEGLPEGMRNHCKGSIHD